MTEIQLLQTLAEGSPALLMLLAFVYYARDAQRRERDAREDFAKREADLRAESKHREELLLEDGKRREALLIAEFQRREELLTAESKRREESLLTMLNNCAERFDKFANVMARIETWLRKTD